MSEIVNKVKQSKLETVDLESFLKGEAIEVLDIKHFLFKQMILREKEFRENLDKHDWSRYQDTWLSVTCSTDAIIPSWAWMLVTACAEPFAKEVFFGDQKDVRLQILERKIKEFDWENYRDKYVLLKGCSKTDVPAGAYIEATKKLIPVAGKLMYGEACSNVPVYRKPRRS